jgi:hypothetical protein
MQNFLGMFPKRVFGGDYTVKLKEKEMKKLMGLIAAVALMASASVANAVDHAWFTYEGGTCTGVQVTASGPGQMLTIVKDAAPTCNIVIGYRVTSNEQQNNMASYAFRLDNGADLSLVSVDQSPGAGLFPTPFSFGGSLIDIGALNSSPAGVTGAQLDAIGNLVAKFTIQIAKPNAGSHLITGGWGSSDQALTQYAWQGSAGPNPSTDGASDSWGTLPVISITNVPEPATLALLGFGAFALIRRRR